MSGWLSVFIFSAPSSCFSSFADSFWPQIKSAAFGAITWCNHSLSLSFSLILTQKQTHPRQSGIVIGDVDLQHHGMTPVKWYSPPCPFCSAGHDFNWMEWNSLELLHRPVETAWLMTPYHRESENSEHRTLLQQVATSIRSCRSFHQTLLQEQKCALNH